MTVLTSVGYFLIIVHDCASRKYLCFAQKREVLRGKVGCGVSRTNVVNVKYNMNKTEISLGLVGKDVFWNCCLSLYCNTCTNNIDHDFMLRIQYSCFHPCHLSDLLSLFFTI